MSPRPRRNEQQTNLLETIKESAWKQIAEQGAPALSLRAIARDLGITAPAIYNYYPDRDALVTVLIIDAYTSLGDSQLAARDAVPVEDVVGRLQAIGMEYRNWALTYPQRYHLIFGAPIPGYIAPFEQILPAAARSLSALMGAVEALRLAGRLQAENFPTVSPGYESSFEIWKSYAGRAEILSLSVAMIIWSRAHGLVSLELAGNMPPFGLDGNALYLYEMESISKQFIKG
jgi:AcrR family transcriptional regulator